MKPDAIGSPDPGEREDTIPDPLTCCDAEFPNNGGAYWDGEPCPNDCPTWISVDDAGPDEPTAFVSESDEPEDWVENADGDLVCHACAAKGLPDTGGGKRKEE